MTIATTVTGLNIRDIVTGIHELSGVDRRGGSISFEVDARVHEARYAKGMVALAGISNVQTATDMSYQLHDADFTLKDGKIKVEFKAEVGDSDGYLDRVSYVIFAYS